MCRILGAITEVPNAFASEIIDNGAAEQLNTR